MKDVTTRCHICDSPDAMTKCSKCGKDICPKCSVDYFGKTICIACGMPLIGFFCNMHGDPGTSVESNK